MTEDRKAELDRLIADLRGRRIASAEDLMARLIAAGEQTIEEIHYLSTQLGVVDPDQVPDLVDRIIAYIEGLVPEGKRKGNTLALLLMALVQIATRDNLNPRQLAEGVLDAINGATTGEPLKLAPSGYTLIPRDLHQLLKDIPPEGPR